MILPWKTLIVDDEKLARDRLKQLLSKHKTNIQIVGEARDGNETAKLIEEIKPELIFLDIEMPGKNVFDVLSESHHKPFIVFCTAYDKYALHAFNTFSVDYLVKPVEEARLQLTINKILKIGDTVKNEDYSDVLNNLRNLYDKPKIPTSIPHKVGNRIVLVKIENIVYFNAHEKYVNFFDIKGDTFITDLSLATLEKKLPENIIRVSKSCMINKSFIKEIQKYFRGRFVFVMNDRDQTKIISGASYNAYLREQMEL